jgi:hypothetical protein
MRETAVESHPFGFPLGFARGFGKTGQALSAKCAKRVWLPGIGWGTQNPASHMEGLDGRLIIHRPENASGPRS